MEFRVMWNFLDKKWTCERPGAVPMGSVRFATFSNRHDAMRVVRHLIRHPAASHEALNTLLMRAAVARAQTAFITR